MTSQPECCCSDMRLVNWLVERKRKKASLSYEAARAAGGEGESEESAISSWEIMRHFPSNITSGSTTSLAVVISPKTFPFSMISNLFPAVALPVNSPAINTLSARISPSTLPSLPISQNLHILPSL